MLLLSVSIVVCVLYFSLILILYFGWHNIPNFEPDGKVDNFTKLSVVVPCRNEEEYLRRLLSSLAQQSYQNFELILVDDHSTDRTQRIMRSVEDAFSDIKIIEATGFGKKNALFEGIQMASGNLIVTTDADCVPSFLWLESIVNFQNESRSDLIIAPVRLRATESIFFELQYLEFTSLVASGAAAAGAGKAILCNGANLAFTKSAWIQSIDDMKFDQPSGDDIFLLQSIKKRGGVIRFLKSEAAFVIAEPSKTIKDFFIQRRRWAAKSPSYTDFDLIFTAIIVLAISIYPFVMIAVSAFEPHFLWLFLMVMGFKLLVDMIFLYSVRSFFHLRKVWLFSILLSIIYPIYIVAVSFSAFFVKPKKWK